MKGGKQRQAETRARQKKSRAKSKSVAPAAFRMIPVNEALLAPHNSYGVPDFVRRGYYVDVSFRCADCGSEEFWTGAQQKWWYEVAKGFAYSTAIRCRRCRRNRREQRAETRRIHLEGKAQKTRGTK